jgi:hypothetical protein
MLPDSALAKVSALITHFAIFFKWSLVIPGWMDSIFTSSIQNGQEKNPAPAEGHAPKTAPVGALPDGRAIVVGEMLCHRSRPTVLVSGGSSGRWIRGRAVRDLAKHATCSDGCKERGVKVASFISFPW